MGLIYTSHSNSMCGVTDGTIDFLLLERNRKRTISEISVLRNKIQWHRQVRSRYVPDIFSEAQTATKE
jgi:hypothetical protein